MTLPEYNLLMEAVKLKNVDLDYRAHQQAFLNYSVQAKKKVGKNKEKPVYTRFDKFFDYDKQINAVRGKKQDTFSALKEKLKKGGQTNA